MTDSSSDSTDQTSIEDQLILDALGLLDDDESLTLQRALKALPKSELDSALNLQADWAANAPLPLVSPPPHLRSACIAAAARAAEQSPEQHLKLTLSRQSKSQRRAARSNLIWRAAALAMFGGLLATVMLNNQSLTWQNQQARLETNQNILDGPGISPKINGLLANRANDVLTFGQSGGGSGQLIWNDQTGDLVFTTRGLPKNVASVQITVNGRVAHQRTFTANNGQFQVNAVENTTLRNTSGQTVTISFLDQDEKILLTKSIVAV